MTNSWLRRLPAVHAVLDHPLLADLRLSKGREAIVAAVRAAIQAARQDLDEGRQVAVDIETLARRAARGVAIYANGRSAEANRLEFVEDLCACKGGDFPQVGQLAKDSFWLATVRHRALD